jgi:uncharacterized delta-60 repeat protein
VLIFPFIHIYDAYGFSTWAMSLGGPGTDDIFRGVEAASGGGYIVAGTTDSFGAGKNDAWIIKLDEEGNAVWQRTYGGKGGDVARAIKSTADGGFVIGGLTYSFTSGGADFWVLKFDANENLQWQKSYGGPQNDMAHAIEPTSDGGFLVGGFTTSFGAVLKDYFVIKLDSEGDVQWQKRFGGAKDEVVRILKETSDGKYLVGGFSHSFGKAGDIMVLKLDSDGNLEWQKRYGGGKFEEPSSILEAPDGYIFLEQSASFSSTSDGWVFKVDEDGNMLWQKRYGGGKFDELSAARLTPDGGFIVAGETKSFAAINEDFWVVKFDSDGVIQWQKRHGGSGIDEAEAIALTPDGGSIVVGTTRSFGVVGEDVWIMRLDSAGEVSNCAPGVTTNMDTTANTFNTNAVIADTTVTAADTSVSIKNSQPTIKTSSANISMQCTSTPLNNPPVAENDAYSTDKDVTLVVDPPGVLANDTDEDGDTLEAVLESGPANGQLILASDGGFTYDPNPDFTGEDSFTYRAFDGTENSTIATVRIAISAINNDPVALDDAATTSPNSPIIIDVLANDIDADSDPLIVSDFDATSEFGGTVTENPDGTLTYTPAQDFSEVDTFQYTVSDGKGGTDIATVTITFTLQP